jgi:Ca2+-binding RTX toxin-like protein
MQRLDLVGTLTGARFAAPSAQIEIVASGSGAAARWQVINHVSRETVSYAVTQGALGGQTGLSVHGNGRVALTVDGVAGSVLSETVTAAQAAAGAASVTTWLSGSSAVQGQMVEMLAVPAGAATYLYTARPAGSGIAIHEIAANGTLTPRGMVADTAATAAAGVTALMSVTIGTQRILYAGSGTEHGVQAWAIGANGALTALGVQGPAQGVPMQGVAALRSVVLDGQTYVIAAAWGSSSLTVFRAGTDGRLTVVDHVIDDLATRFANASVLDAIVVDGHVFVIAGGSDEGLSLFTMAPGGRLVHLSSLADAAGMSLANVSALEMVRVGSEVQVLVASGAEAGITLLRLNLDGLGDVIAASAATQTGSSASDLMFRRTGQGVLEGGSGDDILIDGDGADELRGGAGADVFVLTADGRRDVIRDFQPSVDRIDLSLWPFLRSNAQLQVTSTATGAIIAFGAEVLEIFTAPGTPLTVAQVLAMSVLPVSRVALGDAANQPAGQRIEGTGSADTLTGGAGDDTIEGLGGGDLMDGGGGVDQFSGGSGTDTVTWTSAAEAIRLSLDAPAQNGGAAEGETFDGIEAFVGSRFADTMTGGAGLDALYGGLGDDLIAGEGADDTQDGGAGDDTLRGGEGADRLYGGDGNDLLEGDIGADWLYGGAGNDTLRGGDWSDRLFGDDGNDLLEGGLQADTLDGGAGNDTLIGGGHGDMLAGGDGTDTVTYAAETAGVRIDLMLPSWSAGAAGGDVIGGVENVVGTAFDDRVLGDAVANILTGGAGNDWLDGRDGNDLLFGGIGDDSVKGGTGNDTLHGEAGNDILPGELGNDLLYGGDDRDELGGGDGNDTLYGGRGNDTMGSGPGVDVIHAEDGDDVTSGGYGNDQVYGGTGDDTMAGSYESDLVDGGDGDDMLGGGTGRDTITGGAGNDSIGSGDDDDLVHGDAGNDFLAGGTGHDLMFGGDGDDRLNGGEGNDTMQGGAGADVFVFATFQPAEVDRIDSFQNGIDRIQMTGVLGAGAAGRFAALDIDTVRVDGTNWVRVDHEGHQMLISGISVQDLDAADFIWT